MTDSNLSPSTEPRSPRVGTIVWGMILISIAALFFIGAQLDLSHLNAGVVVAWTVIGVGVVAIIGGIAAAIARRR